MEKQLAHGEKFVRISLEDCQWPTMAEYQLVALRIETRFGFVRVLMNKRSETIKDAIIDMQLLLRRAWRFHNDEGREFMGAVDD